MPRHQFSSTNQPSKTSKGVDRVKYKLTQVYSPDVGCRYAPKCLECPLSECAYDKDEVEVKDGRIIMRKRISTAQVVAELEALGLPLPRVGQKRVKGTGKVLHEG